jgi:hypothetical protein
MISERFAKQRDLSIWLTIILPLYTVAYLMQWYNYLDYLQVRPSPPPSALDRALDLTPAMCSSYPLVQLVALYQILSVLTKGLFAAVTMDMHADLLIKFELREEQRANEARRAFMKYLFHEVRKTRPSLAHPLFVHSTLCTHATTPSAHRRRLFDPLPFSSLPPPSHHTHHTHHIHLSPQVRTPLVSLTPHPTSPHLTAPYTPLPAGAHAAQLVDDGHRHVEAERHDQGGRARVPRHDAGASEPFLSL